MEKTDGTFYIYNAMIDKERHIRALVTGHESLGLQNYALIPAKAIPSSLSLRGDKPFAMVMEVCLKNVLSGCLVSQDGIFTIEIENGGLFVKIPSLRIQLRRGGNVERLQIDKWYFILLSYDGKQLRIHVNGTSSCSSQCSYREVARANTDITIGKGLEGFFKSFRLYNAALSENEILGLLSGGAVVLNDKCVADFDFNQNGMIDRSPGKVKLSLKVFARIAEVYPIMQLVLLISNPASASQAVKGEQVRQSQKVNFRGCMERKANAEGSNEMYGTVSLDIIRPYMSNLKGEVRTIWEAKKGLSFR